MSKAWFVMADAGFCRIIEVGDGSTTKMHSPVFRDTLETSHAIDLHSDEQEVSIHDCTCVECLLQQRSSWLIWVFMKFAFDSSCAAQCSDQLMVFEPQHQNFINLSRRCNNTRTIDTGIMLFRLLSLRQVDSRLPSVVFICFGTSSE